MLEKHQVKNRKQLKFFYNVNAQHILNIQSISDFHLCWIYYCVFAIMFCLILPYWDVSMTWMGIKSNVTRKWHFFAKCLDVWYSSEISIYLHHNVCYEVFDTQIVKMKLHLSYNEFEIQHKHWFSAKTKLILVLCNFDLAATNETFCTSFIIILMFTV